MCKFCERLIMDLLSQKSYKNTIKTEYGREGNHCIHHAFFNKTFLFSALLLSD